LADILPDLLLKFTFPFVMQRIPFHLRIAAIVAINAASFIIVSY